MSNNTDTQFYPVIDLSRILIQVITQRDKRIRDVYRLLVSASVGIERLRQWYCLRHSSILCPHCGPRLSHVDFNYRQIRI